MGALRTALAAAMLAWPAAAVAGHGMLWDDAVAQAAARFAIPEAWIRSVIRAESGGRDAAGGRPIVSRAGAMGLMQLMPGTWREMRDDLSLGADPHDPADNILAGTAYLRRMYDRFGYPGLFAAYNAGPARYAAFLAGRRSLPSETQAYVAAVTRLLPGATRVAAAAPALFAIDTARGRAQSRAVRAVAAPLLFVRLGRPSSR